MSANPAAGGAPPLTEATFLILLCLADGPLHGYAIMKGVVELSSGHVRLSTGTLYGAIKRFLDAGWIERVGGVSPESDVKEPPRTRKAYRLTNLGERVLSDEASRLQRLLRAASRIKAGGLGKPVSARDQA
jgi:DNA-binding PadR family transcriptional regulator